ncbi:MAG: hypothetical protein J7J96_01835 [Sulfurimonas sp.]|nr:hypothetical protein [Sulfurimonas sp.]
MAKMLVENSMHGELKVISEKGNTIFEIKIIEDRRNMVSINEYNIK